uniref:RNA-binding protein KhpA n=2 Tax=Paracidobacterium acidisoli TaxID=2303751 RepID=A0A372ITC6_9BACT
MCALVIEIAKALVDEDEDVRVDVLVEPETTTLQLHVAEGDVAKLIGRHGHTARSLRTIISAASMKLKRRYALDIAGAKPWHEAQ